MAGGDVRSRRDDPGPDQRAIRDPPPDIARKTIGKSRCPPNM